jgi:hypothetical protein
MLRKGPIAIIAHGLWIGRVLASIGVQIKDEQFRFVPATGRLMPSMVPQVGSPFGRCGLPKARAVQYRARQVVRGIVMGGVAGRQVATIVKFDNGANFDCSFGSGFGSRGR